MVLRQIEYIPSLPSTAIERKRMSGRLVGCGKRRGWSVNRRGSCHDGRREELVRRRRGSARNRARQRAGESAGATTCFPPHHFQPERHRFGLGISVEGRLVAGGRRCFSWRLEGFGAEGFCV